MKLSLFAILLLPALALAQTRKASGQGRNPASSVAAALQQAFATHLQKIQQKEKAIEDPTERTIVYGDVNGDGSPDAVVQYTLENARGNGWGQSLAVFLYHHGAYQLAADEVVGGKYFRWFRVVKMVGPEIIGQTLTCPGTSAQAMCKNPLKKQVKLALVGTTLREK